MRTAYKIFDIHIDKNTGEPVPKTLFHGVQGCRQLAIGEWIKADIKWGTDGSRQHPYRTGFHAYPTLESVEAWLLGAKNLDHRVVVKVRIDKGIRKKPRAVRDTLLANRLYISKKDWQNRMPARDFLRKRKCIEENS